MFNLYVEIAEALVIIPQPAVAFIQQILVDCAFFKYGDARLSRSPLIFAPSTLTFTTGPRIAEKAKVVFFWSLSHIPVTRA